MIGSFRVAAGTNSVVEFPFIYVVSFTMSHFCVPAVDRRVRSGTVRFVLQPLRAVHSFASGGHYSSVDALNGPLARE
jgi:hypothetical protein